MSGHNTRVAVVARYYDTLEFQDGLRKLMVEHTRENSIDQQRIPKDDGIL